MHRTLYASPSPSVPCVETLLGFGWQLHPVVDREQVSCRFTQGPSGPFVRLPFTLALSSHKWGHLVAIPDLEALSHVTTEGRNHTGKVLTGFLLRARLLCLDHHDISWKREKLETRFSGNLFNFSRLATNIILPGHVGRYYMLWRKLPQSIWFLYLTEMLVTSRLMYYLK